MHRTSGQDRHARRPALKRCEDRILQSITAGPVSSQPTQSQVTASTSVASRIAVVYTATPDRAPAIFDDPFFFDPN
jgi:hypothetical protein